MNLVPITVWFSVRNGGDGSAYPAWFLTKEDAQRDQKEAWEPWGEECIGLVETFEGSNVHISAIQNTYNKSKSEAWEWLEETRSLRYMER